MQQITTWVGSDAYLSMNFFVYFLLQEQYTEMEYILLQMLPIQ